MFCKPILHDIPRGARIFRQNSLFDSFRKLSIKTNLSGLCNCTLRGSTWERNEQALFNRQRIFNFRTVKLAFRYTQFCVPLETSLALREISRTFRELLPRERGFLANKTRTLTRYSKHSRLELCVQPISVSRYRWATWHLNLRFKLIISTLDNVL